VNALTRRLARVLTQRDDDGALAYSTEAVNAFVPLMYLEIVRAHPDVELPSDARAELSAWLTPEGKPASVAELEARLEAKLADPEVSRLRAAVEGALREALAEDSEVSDALASFAGDKPTRRPLQGERPAGTIAAGPLARFLMD
jgi:hypothetical protein